MSRYDFRTTRLYVDAPLTARAVVALDRDQVNYLANVLRLSAGDRVLLFNGRDGEWQARLIASGKRHLNAIAEEKRREQNRPEDLHLLFAPLKHARLDYLVQKAVEMGASRLQPTITRHTQVARVNIERMRANAVEAAQQCGILSLPEVAEPLSIDEAMACMEKERLLVFCDEDAEVKNPIEALRAVKSAGLPVAVLIGPEGGFSEEERTLLKNHPNVVRLSLGPRILRADTAAVAALAVTEAALGYWDDAHES